MQVQQKPITQAVWQQRLAKLGDNLSPGLTECLRFFQYVVVGRRQ